MGEGRDGGRLRPLARFEKVALAFIGLGLSLRLLALIYLHPGYDGSVYIQMAASLIEHGEFMQPWLGPETYSHHFPPAFPAVLALVFLVFGVSIWSAILTTVLVSALLIGVTFFTTKDLYGRERAFAVTAVVACFPTLLRFDVDILGESLVTAFFALTIWGIIKSLDKPPYIVLAGVFASLGYLAKASMGPFFLLAGGAGLAWRFYYMRWRVFTDRWYMLAAGIFASAVLFWAGRNVLRHGWPNWETQPHASDAIRYLFREAPWPEIVAKELVWTFVVLVSFGAAFLPGVRRSVRRILEEKTSALWMAIVTPAVVAVFFVSGFYALEGYADIATTVNDRYLVTPLVPLLWLGMRELDFSERTPPGRPAAGARLISRHAMLVIAGLGVTALFLALNPVKPYTSFYRIVIYYFGVAAGIVIMMAALAFAWRAQERVGKGGEREWRAVHDDEAGKRALPAIGWLAFGLVIAAFAAVEFLPFYAAGAAATLLRDARWKVGAVCVLFAASTLWHNQTTLPVEPIAEDVDALAWEGATVWLPRPNEHYLWPYLEGSKVTLVDSLADDPDFIVDYIPNYYGAQPLDGYVTVREYQKHYAFGPGTELGLVVWGKVLGDQAEPPVRYGAWIYQKNGTGPAP